MSIVMVVEDSFIVLETVSIMLCSLGHGVIKTSGAREALEYLDGDQKKPDLIISDIIMPEMDGIEFMIQLRERQTGIPVIAMSGGGYDMSARSLLIEAARFAEGVLEKPFLPEELATEIANAFNRAKV